MSRQKIEAPPPGFKRLFSFTAGGVWFGRLAWSPDGRRIAAGASDATIWVWDATTGSLIRQVKGGPRSVVSLFWMNGEQLLTLGNNKGSGLRVWSVEDGNVRLRVKGFSDEIREASCSADGLTIAAVESGGTIRLWDAVSGEPGRCIEERVEIAGILWSPIGGHLAVRGPEGGVWLRDGKSGEFVKALAGRLDNPVLGLSWSPDAKLLAGTFFGGRVVLIWSAETGEVLQRLEGHRDHVRSVSFSADGKLLASKSDDNTVRLWRTDEWSTVEILQEPASKRWPPSLAFHPRDPVLATLGGEDTEVRLWQLDLLSEATKQERKSLLESMADNRRLGALEKGVTEWVIVRADRVEEPHAHRHLRQGFFQRHQMMSASRRRIFDETHNRENQLDPELTVEPNVHINAYYLNLHGALDNLAWMLAYALHLKPNLKEGRRDHQIFCNLFGEPFLKVLEEKLPDLAEKLRQYCVWKRDIKAFRDPAAHRIPLYMAPGFHTDATTAQREELAHKASEAAQRGDSSAWLGFLLEIRNLAVYLPAMVTSETAGLQMHALPQQLPKDQGAFLDIVTAILHNLLGPFRPMSYLE